jgi:hypothetical protein
VGETIAADLSAIAVEVEVWNNTESEPAAAIRGGLGRTERAGEWRSAQTTAVEVDAIVDARWDTNWVVPAGDPEEPAKGKAGMIIKVKNVRDGTPVHLAVKRIQDIADPSSDFSYVDDVGSGDQQQGLQGAVVKGNKVVLANGKNPTCEFNNYDEHWIHEGNNFYSFWVAFGDGDAMAASERDYENNEHACVHMRFTVFIHTASPEFDVDVSSGNRLHQFFRRETKYYRSYQTVGSPASVKSWIDHFKHRYIVIINGHGGAGCFNAAHPQEPVPGAKKPKDDKPVPTQPKQMYHSGFDPDLYVCPTTVLDTDAARKSVKADAQHYLKKGESFGGCGNVERVVQQFMLGSPGGHKTVLSPIMKDLPAGSFALVERVNKDKRNITPVSVEATAPRMFLYSGGCRSMIITTMGKKFVDPPLGTRYYGGFVYSVAADSGDAHMVNLFTRWIKGTAKDPAPVEYDTSRIEDAFRDASAIGDVAKFHPRLMDRGGPKSPGGANDGISSTTGDEALA